jgi:hypothetical protein
LKNFSNTEPPFTKRLSIGVERKADFSKIALRAALLSGAALSVMHLGTNVALAQVIQCVDGNNYTLPTNGTWVEIDGEQTCGVTIENGTVPDPNNAQNLVQVSGSVAGIATASEIINNSQGYGYSVKGSLIMVDQGGRVVRFINNGDLWVAVDNHRVISIGGANDQPEGQIDYFLNNVNAVIGTTSGSSRTLHAVENSGAIGTMINLGQILGWQTSIRNFGTINELHNAQGGDQPLTYKTVNSGTLPKDYFVVIRGADDFGRLQFPWNPYENEANAPTDGMRFGISQYSSTPIAPGTYSDVLINIPSSALSTDTRVAGPGSRYEWEIKSKIVPRIDSNIPDVSYDTTNWDLIVYRWLGSDPLTTRQALQSNASAVSSVLSQNAAATTYALNYDCSIFDKHGLCVSIGLRNSQIGGSYKDSGETAGLLTAAYRINPNLRIGGFLDKNLVSNRPAGVKSDNELPIFGAFAAYQENLNHEGLTMRAALAYQKSDLRITRPEIVDTEAGTGKADASALAFGGEIAYGFAIDKAWVAQPYVGVQRSESKRRGYTETSSIEYPISYNRFGQMVTSATAGLRLHGAITPKFSLSLAVGVENDTESKMDRYSGTSDIVGSETFSINASQQRNRTRTVGSAGVRYMIKPNQAVAFDASVRQLPYGNDSSITAMLRYTLGF